jgi:hypothetical protein
MTARSRSFRPSAPMSLETRALLAAWLPQNLAYPGVPIRVAISGGTATDQGLVRTVFSDVLSGTRIAVRSTSIPRADLIVVIGTEACGATGLPGTTGVVQHRPPGKGWCVITIPDAPTPDMVAHEFLHALGFIHVSQGPSAPAYTDQEWARLDAYGASIGWTTEVVRSQFGKQFAARDHGYDPQSIMNIDPFTHPDSIGPGPHLSPGDRQAIHDLLGTAGNRGRMRR